MPRLDHPDDCGCQVCRDYRERLEVDPRARELDASDQEVDQHAPDPGEWRDPEPVAGDEPEPVVVEHHHYEHADQPPRPAEGKRPKDGKPGKPGRRGKDGKGRRHGILRTVAAGVVLVWVLQSFYPELDVPLLPIDCTDAGAVTPAVDADPTIGLPFVDLGSKVKDLAEDTVAAAAKKFVLAVVGGALNVAGDTVRVMASHPPTVDGIRTGLQSDVETVGKAVGFVVGALTGEDVGSLVGSNVAAVPVSGCAPCPSAGTVQAGSSSGAELAARAALAAGWTGEDAVTAVAIAGAESGYDPEAANASSTARGMWQTMMSLHAGKYGPGESWTDPAANARVAHAIYEAQGWGAWTVYTSGAYRAHLEEARAAIAAVAQGSDAIPVAVKMPGLQPPAQRAADYVRATWGVDDIGGYATSGHVTGSKHYSGLAIDVMTYGDKALGQRIYDYFAGPGYGPFGVDNVIFNRRIFNAGRGDHDYGDHGNPTLNHEDHVHVDFHEAGGSGVIPAAAACAVSPVAAGEGWRVGTFNILGAGHTPGSWRERWPGVPKLLAGSGVSVAGLQEVHPEQRPLVDGMPGWATFGDWDAVTAWRTDTWTLLERRYVEVPLYPGRTRLEPLVRLRHRSGPAVWFLNVHNSRIPALQREDQRLELAAVSRLSGPVVWLGDTNSRAFAGWASGVGFRPAGTRGIDQIVGTTGARLTGGTRVDRAVVGRTSDHVLVYADLSLASFL